MMLYVKLKLCNPCTSLMSKLCVKKFELKELVEIKKEWYERFGGKIHKSKTKS